MVKKQVDIVIKKYIEQLRVNKIAVKKAILYGSYANGTPDNDSDIDLAIVANDFGENRLNEALLLRKLTRGIDLDISPRPYSVKQYQSATQGDFLYDEIICKGKIVFEG
ncbi:nucleotidyltransferase domain-containing protein [Desulforamulus aeronauticus]|uniref:Predicted nucleotidyltransferase n=1 Tax=Desulforamulus aeronauticus DSM 10349 TaxID=1121421 RepID=A0A1M6SF62_9FIRM|nr:nucleotidyltransferase domain-containing protein [Desulforamulus aeronauticus]SHK43361.1 Predicted nucleotidyltransferase [Desulforamulus aeronauticus DSM 10349]